MARRIGIAAFAMTAWVLVMGLALQSAPASASQSEFHFLDRFLSRDYDGNQGNTDFDSAWQEYFDTGGASKGAVSVDRGGECPDDDCVRISGDAREFWGTGLARRARFTDAASATLRFDYRLDIVEETNGRFDVAVFNGMRWTVLASFDLADESDNEIHTRTYNVVEYAAKHFYIGFFAYGEWNAELSIDNVEIFGEWDSTATTTSTPPTTTSSTTTTTSTQPPTTTTSSTTTTTTQPPTTTTIPPTSTTTTTLPPSVTTVPPPTTLAPPTTPPPTTPPPTTAPTPPPTTTAAPSPTTIRAPAPKVPLTADERYTLKGELALLIEDDLMAMPSELDDIPSPSPVTQIAATVTTTALTLRSQLLPASALGLLIAAAAVFGLGRFERHPRSRSPVSTQAVST